MVNKDAEKSGLDSGWSIRKEYTRSNLVETDLKADPLEQFSFWYAEAVANQLEEPNAMALATSDMTGHSVVRFVLLKGHDQQGFRFFTNYESAKARALAKNPQASLAIYWKELERQVRIEGLVSRLPEQESDNYFSSRPRTAQIGAWASLQSKPLPNRQALEDRFKELENKYPEGTNIPRPDYWGGFILKPLRYEFWQGRVGRLHDRFEFVQDGNAWLVKRLFP